MKIRSKSWLMALLMVSLIGTQNIVMGDELRQIDCADDDFEPSATLLADWPNTDFCKFKFPSNQFRSGGPPRDGIPPLYPDGYVYPDDIVFYGGDEPDYVVAYEKIEEASNWLPDQNPVIVVEVNNEARAYPLEILTRHEIANTTIGGVPVAVTFCPLCNTGIVFERVLDGQEYHFGVSGYLRNSDMIMWDHETESWWQQATGEAVVGGMTGQQLKFLSSNMVSYADFKVAHPASLVLSSGGRNYNYNPYTGYDSSLTPFLFDGNIDDRLPAMERVVGYAAADGIAVAYPFDLLEEAVVVNDFVEGQAVAVFWQPGAVSALDSSTISEARAIGSAAVYSRTLSDGMILDFVAEGTTIQDVQTGSTWNIFGQAVAGDLEGMRLTLVIATPHFWFAWSAFQPTTLIWQVGVLTDDQ